MDISVRSTASSLAKQISRVIDKLGHEGSLHRHHTRDIDGQPISTCNPSQHGLYDFTNHSRANYNPSRHSTMLDPVVLGVPAEETVEVSLKTASAATSLTIPPDKNPVAGSQQWAEPARGACMPCCMGIVDPAVCNPSHYFTKWSGGVDAPLARPPAAQLFWSWLGSFLGILLVAGLHHVTMDKYDFQLLIGSFGASAVLVYGVPDSKMAQPRNLMIGQVMSAVIGVCVRLALADVLWLSAALAMSLALLAMQITCTTHPPGGATALIIGSAKILPPWSGFQFVVTVLFGTTLILAVGLLVNNLALRRRYPTFWM